ncbi:MAG: hypothetical protein IJT94_09900, partial [Oscillibacter sp.]|nr:hypothetical protein [Oscillibacter sp.]
MKNLTRRLLPFASLTLLVCALLTVPALAVEAGAEAAGPALYGTWYALLPPLIAIVLALITKEAYSSLFLGVLVGAFLVCDFHPVRALDTVIGDGFMTAIEEDAGIFLFLVLLGTVVALVNAAGGSAAFGRWAEKNIHTRVGAQLATFLLGVLIFIDDYFNCLTVGSVMRPVTDSHRISRTKLAFLIDATAAPVCMIAPVSSWAAAVSGTAEKLDTGISGIQLFIQAIPYNLYSLLTLLFIVLLAFRGFDYGPMRTHEKRARRTGDLGALDAAADKAGNPNGRISDLVLPVLVLIAACTAGMLYVGGFFGTDWWGGTGLQWDFIGAFGNTDAFVGLPWGSIIALVLIVAYLLLRRVISFKDAMACLPKGFNAMVPAMLILTLAVSLKNLTSTLGAADFVHDVMEGAAQNLYNSLPAVIFLVACVLAFASGTSWGTFGILIPIVTAIFPADSPLLIIGISACLAGAVCGDHCSPISDTTIMASAGAQVEHINHVSTQLPYALTVAAVSFGGFLVAGFTQDLYLTWGVSAGALLVVLIILRIGVAIADHFDKDAPAAPAEKTEVSSLTVNGGNAAGTTAVDAPAKENAVPFEPSVPAAEPVTEAVSDGIPVEAVPDVIPVEAVSPEPAAEEPADTSEDGEEEEEEGGLPTPPVIILPEKVEEAPAAEDSPAVPLEEVPAAEDSPTALVEEVLVPAEEVPAADAADAPEDPGPVIVEEIPPLNEAVIPDEDVPALNEETVELGEDPIAAEELETAPVEAVSAPMEESAGES